MADKNRNKNYTFSVDQTDPKYSKLINFLDNMEKGARSFVIRQILNFYVNSQTGEGVFNLLGGSVNISENKTEEVKEKDENNKPQETTNNVNTTKKSRPPELKNLKSKFS